MSAASGWINTSWEWLVWESQCLKVFLSESSKIVVKYFLICGKRGVVGFFTSCISWNLECIKLISKDKEWSFHVVETVLAEHASELLTLWLIISAVLRNDILSLNLKIFKEQMVCHIKWWNCIWVQRFKVQVEWRIVKTKDIKTHWLKNFSNLIKMDHTTDTTSWVAAKHNGVSFVLSKSLVINEMLEHGLYLSSSSELITPKFFSLSGTTKVSNMEIGGAIWKVSLVGIPHRAIFWTIWKNTSKAFRFSVIQGRHEVLLCIPSFIAGFLVLALTSSFKVDKPSSGLVSILFLSHRFLPVINGRRSIITHSSGVDGSKIKWW